MLTIKNEQSEENKKYYMQNEWHISIKLNKANFWLIMVKKQTFKRKLWYYATLVIQDIGNVIRYIILYKIVSQCVFV